jgi:hypothetical protein
MTTTGTTAGANDPTRNGVDTATLFATLDAVKQAPDAAKFQFRAHNQWVSGTHNRSTITEVEHPLAARKPETSISPEGARS